MSLAPETVYYYICYYLWQATQMLPSVIRVWYLYLAGMNYLRFEESQQDTAHPGNDLKRPRTTGNFGEVSSFGYYFVCSSVLQ